jgi:ribosomal protein L11 methyltransferase
MLRELVLTVAADAAEPFADALLAAGALAVSIEDAEADTPGEAALYGEPGAEPARRAWNCNRVIAQFDASVDGTALVQDAAIACALPAAPPFDLRDVPDDDWVRRTQAQFPPQRIGTRLWIVPSWHEPPSDPDALVIRLDPGVAFGTGTHPTTRLCLEWLDEHLQPGLSVLDYGCGSGILAIAAARLGAQPVDGTDVDAQSLAAARANAERNAVPVRFAAPDALPHRRYDVVVANILASPLRVLAPLLVARCAAGGALVLSGLLDAQADELTELYRSLDAKLALATWRSAEGWTCLAGRIESGESPAALSD